MLGTFNLHPQVADQPETRHIGCRVRPDRAHRFGGLCIEARHHVRYPLYRSRAERITLQPSVENAGAQRLCDDEKVLRLRPFIPQVGLPVPMSRPR